MRPVERQRAIRWILMSLSAAVAMLATLVNDSKAELTTAPSSEEASAFAQMLVSREWNDKNLRKAILEAARVSNAKECGIVLARALTDSDGEIRCMAIDSLKDYRWIGDAHIEGLISNVEGKDAACRTRALKLLGSIDDARALRVIVAALEDSDSDMRQIALACLAQQHKQGIPSEILDTLIADKDASVRIACLRVVARSRPKGWEKYALRGMEDQDDGVRITAASLCAGMKVPGLKVENLKSLLANKNPEVRSQAVMAVPSSDDGGPEILETLLQDPSPNVRRAIAVAAWYLPPNDAGPLFQKLLNDKDQQVRMMVVQRVTKLEPKQAVALLSQACLDKDSSVAIAAIELLMKRDQEKASQAAQSIYNSTASAIGDKERIVRLSPQMAIPVASAVLWDAMHSQQDSLRKAGMATLRFCDAGVLTALIAIADNRKDTDESGMLKTYLNQKKAIATPTTATSTTAGSERRGGASSQPATTRP